MRLLNPPNLLDPRIRLLPNIDSAQFAWRSLKKFHNVDRTTALICKERDIPRKHLRNVRKQMQQMRFCLLQAQEYFDASEVASLATKPLQLYYCCMSLALAEILWKGDGNSSLDKLRSEHRHHGLLAKIPSKLSTNPLDAALKLSAEPMIRDDRRIGTFEVWHRFARHAPIIGELKTHLRSGGTIERPAALLLASDSPIREFPANGISLLDCFRRVPGIGSYVRDLGTESVLVRARIQQSARELDDGALDIKNSLTIQPGNDQAIQRLRDNIYFDANAVDQIDSHDFPSGFSVQWEYKKGENDVYCNMPECFSHSKKYFYFLDKCDYLNEFGFIYIGLFITGMFARYFPDVWMREIERTSDISITIEHFLDVARERMPLLLLGVLDSTVHIHDE